MNSIKAFFVDFYGTVVYEDGEIVKRISNMIYESGNAGSIEEVDVFWWQNFQRMCAEANGDKFQAQRTLELKSVQNTLVQYDSLLNADELAQWMFDYWVKPDIFEDSRIFFERCPIPIYIVSNIDTGDIKQAIDYQGLKTSGVFTSEDAKSYKPRKDIFELALSQTGLNKDEVIHIGDSLGSDVKGASNIGIKALWLNRFGREVPEGVNSINYLLEALEWLNK